MSFGLQMVNGSALFALLRRSQVLSTHLLHRCPNIQQKGCVCMHITAGWAGELPHWGTPRVGLSVCPHHPPGSTYHHKNCITCEKYQDLSLQFVSMFHTTAKIHGNTSNVMSRKWRRKGEWPTVACFKLRLKHQQETLSTRRALEFYSRSFLM
jgi:hypothetical protein